MCKLLIRLMVQEDLMTTVSILDYSQMTADGDENEKWGGS